MIQLYALNVRGLVVSSIKLLGKGLRVLGGPSARSPGLGTLLMVQMLPMYLSNAERILFSKTGS